jgi:hypothetical protein
MSNTSPKKPQNPAFKYDELVRAFPPGKNKARTICSACSAGRSTKASRSLKVLHCWGRPGFISYACIHCGERGYVLDPRQARLPHAETVRIKAQAEQQHRDEVAESQHEARGLWRARGPLIGSIGEVYLRQRNYSGELPPTLGFLPTSKFWNGPQVIAALGVVQEVEPGVIRIDDDAVGAVNIIKLRPDGSDRVRDKQLKPKIIRGKDFPWPIVLAPPNDLLGLAITEGIEKGLAVFAETGLGVWVSASAVRMPGLADKVPDWIDQVSVIADSDPDGRRYALELVAKLRDRGIAAHAVIDGKVIGGVP